MDHTAVPGAHADRLAQFRREWPSHVSWAEVRDADAGVFRTAAWGAVLAFLAVLLGLCWGCLHLEWPVPMRLPDWIEWTRGFLMVAVTWATILAAMLAIMLLTRPSDLRRELAFRRFARERDLEFSRYGIPPRPRGIYLTEGLIAPASRSKRTGTTDRAMRGQRSGHPESLFRSHFALTRGWRDIEPELHLSIAGYSGGKNDPKGPRNAFRLLQLRLPRRLPHLMIDSRANGSLRTHLPGRQRLSLEGDFDRYFTVYVPEGYDRDALELLTPDVMVGLIDYGRNWDIEVVDDSLVVVSHRVRRRADKHETTAMLLFAEVVGEELTHQAVTYTDPRAKRPRFEVSEPGRRLRRRSAVWTVVLFLGVTAAMLGFPFVLGWLLDL